VKLLAPGIALAFAACAQTETSTPYFVDPATVAFDYAAASDASGLPAVSLVSARVADARTEASQPGDVGVEYLRAWDLAFLPAELPVLLPGIAGPGVIPGKAREVVVSHMPYSSCVTAAGGQLRYQGCRAVYPDVTIELDGTFTRSGTALTWNLDLRWSIDESHHLVGELDVGSGQLLGHARDDHVIQGSVSQGYTFTDAVDLALSLDGAGCPVAGTVELKRLFAVRSYDLPDQGGLLAWTGCGVVTVAASTSKR
jgi:hypothetical protein